MRCILFPLQFLIDLFNGLWSGYPWCCVRFFAVRRWNRGYQWHDNWGPAEQSAWEKEWTEGRYVPYVRCLKCVAMDRRVNRIRDGRIPDVLQNTNRSK